MKKNEKGKEKKEIQKKLQETYSGYKIKDVYKDEKNNKFAYTIKNKDEKEIGMILPWELTIYSNDESKKNNQYIIIGENINVFNSTNK